LFNHSVEFFNRLLAQMAERVGESHYGAERQESGEEQAERILAEELEDGAGGSRTWSGGARGTRRRCKWQRACDGKAS
jgi:hypothetical protein